jgi:hypothetical protein
MVEHTHTAHHCRLFIRKFLSDCDRPAVKRTKVRKLSAIGTKPFVATPGYSLGVCHTYGKKMIDKHEFIQRPSKYLKWAEESNQDSILTHRNKPDSVITKMKHRTFPLGCLPHAIILFR